MFNSYQPKGVAGGGGGERKPKPCIRSQLDLRATALKMHLWNINEIIA